jgi:hypothetical protein
VSTPKATGTPVSIAASWRPLAASPAMKSKWAVSPRTTQPSATMHAYWRVFASAIAASGSSKAPGTGTIVTDSRGTPADSSSSSARWSSLLVISPLNFATTTPTARPAPSADPVITL